jgi:hypothetical protein
VAVVTVPRVASLDQINEALADRLEDLLPELIGGGASRGEWVAASTREGGVGDSLVVALRGYKRGKWYHHAAGVGGDPLGLINYMRCNNSDMGRAIGWARDFLGGKIEPETEKDRELRAQRLRSAERKEAREERTRRHAARGVFFFNAQPLAAGDPAWHYLNNRLAGRFAALGHLPGSLRFIAKLKNSQLGVELPAMVASVVDGHGEMIAMHRTWLVKRGAGADSWDRLRPQDLADYGGKTTDGKELKGKKVLGKFAGGTIRLWAGTRINSDTGEVKRGQQWYQLKGQHSIMLAEGIETGLSLALAMPERRIVCTIAIEGFANIVLPRCFNQVVIAADRDPGNKGTAGAIERAKIAHAAAGRHCTVVYPPEGIDDWNTALKEAAARVA